MKVGILAYHDTIHNVLLFRNGKCDFCGLELKS